MHRLSPILLSILISLIVLSPNLPIIAATPIFTGCPEIIKASHCDSVFYQVVAVDISNSGYGNNVRYHLISGPGTVNEKTGLWVYHPELDPPKANEPTPIIEIAASVSHDTTHGDENCQFSAYVRNNPPRFSRRCGETIELTAQETYQSTYAFRPDYDICDVAEYVSALMQPVPSGAFDFDWTTGKLTFTPEDEDEGQVFVFSVGVSDGIDTTYCRTYFNVGDIDPFAVRIGRINGQIQGQMAEIDVTLDHQPFGIGGFDILVSYDASALTFQGATSGSLLIDCGWEYFTYRIGLNANCDSRCPSGMLRIIGIAEINNGETNHPDCFVAPTPSSLFSMQFLVSNDRSLAGTFVPIRFFWIECGDNTLSNQQGTELYISHTVKDFDYYQTGIEDIGPADSLFTYLGAPSSCMDNSYGTSQFIDFQHGGVHIYGHDDQFGLGDLNLDGLSNTLTDAVWLANYFTQGLAAFDSCSDENMYGFVPCSDGAVAHSDVRNDGTVLEVGDFTYMVAILLGNAIPLNCLYSSCISDDTASVWYAPGSHQLTVWSPDTLGAFYCEILGKVTPEPLSSGDMTVAYRWDGEMTKLFIYSFEGESLPSVFTLRWTGLGLLKKMQTGTYSGLTVATRILIPTDTDGDDLGLPNSFALHQNYPNPFNPSTTISFDLPEGSPVTIEIFDITGRLVAEVFNGRLPAGSHTIEWEGRDSNGHRVASGVYLYRVQAGNHVATRKMLMLK